MATATATDNTTPSSPISPSPSSPLSGPGFSRVGSIDIQTANHLFRTNVNRLSSRTTGLDVSLDLTLSSGATLSSASGGYTTGSDCQTSFSLNSHESSSSVGTSYSVKFSAKNFKEKRLASLEAVYQIGDLLGEGGYGEVYRCWHKESGNERAVKVIPKNDLQQSDEQVVEEFNILKECDHPNLLKVYECLEDATHFYIVTEIITGSELYDELDRCGNLSEEDAKVLMNILLTGINYCHQRGLVHRDLKPENILLEQNRDFHQLKIIDFGLAQQVPKSANTAEQYTYPLTGIEGSKYYMSPQVLQGSYSSKCDIWSCGVVAFVMLGGYAPFNGDTEEQVHQAILEGHFDFGDEAWDFVSDDAKEFVMALLTYDEEARPTAEDILKHPWLQTMRDVSFKMDHHRRESTRASLSDLQSFHSADSKLKQATCAIIASQLLNKEETEELDDIFRSLDVSCNGSLSRDDLRQSYQEHFQGDGGVSDDELNELLKQVNFSGTGQIEYSEFVIATMMEKNMIDDEKLQAAFNYFDKEGKGFISPKNLKEVLQIDDSRGGDAYVTKKIIAQVDANGNGLVDFEEFKNMMFSRTVKRLSVRRSSRNRSSITKQFLEDLKEQGEDDDDDDEEGKEEKDSVFALLPPLMPAPRSPSASLARGSVRPLVTETLFEDSEEDYSEDDSATEEEDLFEPGDCDDSTLPRDVIDNPAALPLGSPKRRKARSFCKVEEEQAD